jgi:hypothetical protein
MVFLNDSEISPADVLKPTVFLMVCKCNIWFTPFLSSLSNLVESSNFRSSSSSYKDILRFIKTRYISLNLGRLNYNKCYKQNPKVCIKLLRLSILENDFNELINVARGSCYKSARQKSSKWVEKLFSTSKFHIHMETHVNRSTKVREIKKGNNKKSLLK